MNESDFTCKRCRFLLFKSSQLRNCHGFRDEEVVPFCTLNDSHKEETCESFKNDIFYIDEESLSSWMTDAVSKGEWIKGKLFCPNCNSRIGSYNFINGSQCACEKFVLPPVHIVKSKIDYSRKFVLNNLKFTSNNVTKEDSVTTNNEAQSSSLS